MKAGDNRFTVRWLRYGQPQPYADHVFEFDIVCETVSHQTGEWKPRKLIRQAIDPIARALGKNWVEKDDPKFNWASPYLVAAKETDEGVWRFKVKQAYTV